MARLGITSPALAEPTSPVVYCALCIVYYALCVLHCSFYILYYQFPPSPRPWIRGPPQLYLQLPTGSPSGSYFLSRFQENKTF